MGLVEDDIFALVGYLQKQSEPKKSKKKRNHEDVADMNKRVEEGMAKVARAESAVVTAKSKV